VIPETLGATLTEPEFALGTTVLEGETIPQPERAAVKTPAVNNAQTMDDADRL
jgi:hypothetical protein